MSNLPIAERQLYDRYDPECLDSCPERTLMGPLRREARCTLANCAAHVASETLGPTPRIPAWRQRRNLELRQRLMALGAKRSPVRSEATGRPITVVD
jgi:hypothetical protein